METPMPDMWLKTEVQIRSVDPSRIAIDWLKSEGFEVEMDRFRDTRMEVAEPAAGPIGPLDPEASARYHPPGAPFLIVLERWHRNVRVPATSF
jgi:hypothetical protein